MSTQDQDLYQRAQRYLLGSMLADNSSVTRVLELVTEDDIEEPSYQLIFSSIADLARQDQIVSHISVASDLDAKGNLKKAGGTLGIYNLAAEGDEYRLNAKVEAYARVVKESSAKAKTKRMLAEATPLFQDDSGVQAAEAISTLQASLNENLLNLSDSSTISSFSGDFEEYLELLAERKRISDENQDAEGIQGIPSLLPSINRYTTGWLPGQLVTVGAGTGIGKSIFAVNCAIAAAQSNNAVMFFSLEMGKTELEDRMLSSTTGIPLEHLKYGRLSEDEHDLLRKQMKVMEDYKIVLDVEPKQTVDSIRARALRQAQSPMGLDFIVVDYLQLITPSGRFSNRQEAVADISRNMKLLAKQLGVPIMVLVQMRRKNKDNEENTGENIPKLEEIRESGAIAQDSDIVILLHREQTMDDTTPHTLVILAKNRNGENNKIVRCHSNMECSLFREVIKVKDIEDDMGDNPLDNDAMTTASLDMSNTSFDDDADLYVDSFDLSDDDLLSEDF